MPETNPTDSGNENPDPAVPASPIAGVAPVDQQTARRAPPPPAMEFGPALLYLKDGCRLARAGWNGKDMWIVRQAGYPDGIPINKNTAEATGLPEGSVMCFRPYLMMFTAQGDFVPWVASQSDLLADDWAVVP